MGAAIWVLFLCLIVPSSTTGKREIIDVKGGPDDVVWVVQLSDLHFSVHHSERAGDFKRLVGPTLSMINPSLVLVTGDLTDGKSKDLLIMKQDEEEWVEYQKVMEDVVQRSGLNKSNFYDLRGNHDNFGVPVIGGLFDFFSMYSLNGQLRRSELVNSVTVKTGKRKLLFVGFDSTMSAGLRGPTNLFGHPTDQLLSEISSELSQWDFKSAEPVTKISFGHFPLSFSAASYTQKTLKDIFLKNSISAYLCGHLHTKFGKNLKRQHKSGHHLLTSSKYLQLYPHETPVESTRNCSSGVPPVEEFWEWEMGDWRKSRAMRILAIDSGHVSFVDTNFKSGAKETIILPTFPLDSRYMLTTLSQHQYNCQPVDSLFYGSVRALVFSASPIVSVVARIYDSSPGNLLTVMETSMRKREDASSRGDLYTAPWNSKAFEDPSPDRFWLQIEATDSMGRSTLTELRPFSAKGIQAKLSWTWKEFLVMGCQWDALYYPILWSFYLLMFSVLLIPRAIFGFSKKKYNSFNASKGFKNLMTWVYAELYRVPLVWCCMIVYLFYLLLCPWLFGQVFTEGGERGYMTYKGWVVNFNKMGKLEFLGFPDIMVVVLSHLFLVVLPSFCVAGALAAERGMYRDHLLSVSGKKKDDVSLENKGSALFNYSQPGRSKSYIGDRWIRNILLVVSLAICWKHYKSCRALMRAYEMNPLLHFPFYSLSIPALLAYTVYKTSK
ncbi:hypothetical protein RJ640_001229 [Escallonia rubra]|uniref:Calcineurin-like phosphoesterase domain-containing protein n=1 Tax=Escallonia rubra TaxID=112253 RepID=A0AA88QQ58_9ASTE|nr:hypothetical protein RJ640_001229 [Escallonia rubra]